MKTYTKYLYILIFCLASWGAKSQTYNRTKAIAYANKWWNRFNVGPAKEDGGPYRNYTEDGGDCAAFVSQCLIAGGLNLSKGTDGKGANVGVDAVIPGVLNLIAHLQNYQIVEYTYIQGGADKGEPAFVKPGDPVFITHGSDGRHSIFCVDVFGGKNVYNAHTGPYNNRAKAFWGYANAHCFHIGKYTPSYPAHCENCKQDGDETGPDCGGSCPPCGDAPQNRSITSANISSANYALNDIVTEGAVTITTGQSVLFTAGNTILLDSGFKIQTGAEFIAQATKDRSKITRSLRKVCIFIPNVFTPNGDGINDTFEVILSGIVGTINITIFNSSSQVVCQRIHTLIWDCNFEVWDGRYNGKPAPDGSYSYKMTATDYTGKTIERKGYLAILR